MRAAGFIAWTLAVGAVWLCRRLFLRVEKRAAGGAWTLHVWSRGLCRLLGIRTVVEGEACRGPALRAGNHLGYLDVVTLAAVSPALFVSKDDLAGWPVLGFLGKSVGTLFLDRARPRTVAEVGEGMRNLFALGQAVIVFPEGTTTRGDTLAPFHSSLFEPALRSCVPVQAAAISYAPRHPSDGPDLAAWVGDEAFVPHLWRLFCSHGLTARVTFQEPVSVYLDRRVAAAATRDWIAARLSERTDRAQDITGTEVMDGATLRDITGGEPAPHGLGHGAGLVGGVQHGPRRVGHRHGSAGLAQKGQVVGRVADRHGA
jgi:1-acyl-sn-glycerol-3-phosphate acyltransferase